MEQQQGHDGATGQPAATHGAGGRNDHGGRQKAAMEPGKERG